MVLHEGATRRRGPGYSSGQESACVCRARVPDRQSLPELPQERAEPPPHGPHDLIRRRSDLRQGAVIGLRLAAVWILDDEVRAGREPPPLLPGTVHQIQQPRLVVRAHGPVKLAGVPQVPADQSELPERSERTPGTCRRA